MCVHLVGTEASMVKEGYQNRKDRLEERELNMDDNVTTERFGRFAHFSLKCKPALIAAPENILWPKTALTPRINIGLLSHRAKMYRIQV